MPNFAVSNKKMYPPPTQAELRAINSIDRAEKANQDTTLATNNSNNAHLNSHSEKTLLPPPQVLLAWLAYIYETTGEWVMPPSLALQEPEPEPGTATNSFRTSHKLTNPQDYGNKGSRITSSGFDYVKSIYFAEAERIINTYAKRSVKTELVFGTKLVLGFIIAWCQTPMFKVRGKREGHWMFLATEHTTRELKLRTSSFKCYLEELQALGLIAYGPANDSIISQEEFEQLKQDCTNLSQNDNDKVEQTKLSTYFKPRSIQGKSVIYRLLVADKLKSDLPGFDPFAKDKELSREGLESTTELKVKDQERLINYNKDTRKVLQVLPVSNKITEKTFPVNSCHDSINHNNDNIKHDHDRMAKLEVGSSGKALVESLSPDPKPTTLSKPLPDDLSAEQQIKYDFLTKQTTFAGFSHKDGQTTLDRREALKFALNPALTLTEIKVCYEQVNDSWLKGRCRKNPLGLLHWTLSRRCQFQNNPEKSNSARLSRPHHSYNQQEARKREGWQAATRQPDFEKQPSSSSVVADLEPDELENRLREASSDPKITALPDLARLWKLIKQDDLAGRFRLGQSDLKLLEGSQLHFEEDADQCELSLVLRSVLEERQLGYIARNIIELALRQRLDSPFKLVFRVSEVCP